nr:MAG TPA: hypothetical protein [Caudoviricetes sp.]
MAHIPNFSRYNRLTAVFSWASNPQKPTIFTINSLTGKNKHKSLLANSQTV